MLGDNALIFTFYSILGGFVGAFLCYIALKNHLQKIYKQLEICVADDLNKLHKRMDKMSRKCISRSEKLNRELLPNNVPNVSLPDFIN